MHSLSLEKSFKALFSIAFDDSAKMNSRYNLGKKHKAPLDPTVGNEDAAVKRSEVFQPNLSAKQSKQQFVRNINNGIMFSLCPYGHHQTSGDTNSARKCKHCQYMARFAASVCNNAKTRGLLSGLYVMFD